MDVGTQINSGDTLQVRRIYQLLVIYRWLSLVPPGMALLAGQGGTRALILAALGNLFISLFPRELNHALRKQPMLLLVDLFFCAGLTFWTGGWDSPYYLYTFSPILSAAFFFEWRGALLTAGVMSTLFVLAGIGNPAARQGWLRLVAQVVGHFLIAGTFGYASTLLARLRASHTEIRRAHRDLEVIHHLTLSLQSATDVSEVQEQVLKVVAQELGFARALVALVSPSDNCLTAWIGRNDQGETLLAEKDDYLARISLLGEHNIVAETVRGGAPRLGANNLLTSHTGLNEIFDGGMFHIFPMILRDQSAGVLIVDGSGDPGSARLESLETIARQAAVALGTTMLCIDRAQRLAVQEERLRIARDIHDTVFQSLFGISYTLDACTRLLPEHPDQVRNELVSLNRLAESARSQLRESVLNLWPSELTAEVFVNDLRKYVNYYCHCEGLRLDISVSGDFQGLPPGHRRGLYRIAQEALANITRHAVATQASARLEIGAGQAILTVQDDGQGFSPEAAMARTRDREHFGLRSIRDRATNLGGDAKILSRAGEGTTVIVQIPIEGHPS
jgi:signal transduction histidine kinase